MRNSHLHFLAVALLAGVACFLGHGRASGVGEPVTDADARLVTGGTCNGKVYYSGSISCPAGMVLCGPLGQAEYCANVTHASLRSFGAGNQVPAITPQFNCNVCGGGRLCSTGNYLSQTKDCNGP